MKPWQFGPARPPEKKTAPREKSRVEAHAFEWDRSLPRDWNGSRFCRCGLPGEAGDDRHPFGAPPLMARVFPPAPPEAKEIDDRILGEAGDAA